MKERKRAIINILCPYCQNYYLIRKRKYDKDFQWECKQCVYVYSDNWFNEFTQFERFVTREKEDNLQIQLNMEEKKHVRKTNIS